MRQVFIVRWRKKGEKRHEFYEAVFEAYYVAKGFFEDRCKDSEVIDVKIEPKLISEEKN